MAIIVKCKISSATTDEQGVTKLTLTLTDPQNNSWDKIYTFRQTEIIDLNTFKVQVIADIRRDLKVNAVLDQITPLIGQTFNLTI
jgi:hypothetical protein